LTSRTKHALATGHAVGHSGSRWTQTITTLRAWRADGTGPAWHRRGRRCYYTARDIDAWLALMRVEPAASAPGSKGK
jgi:hypothetical protein